MVHIQDDLLEPSAVRCGILLQLFLEVGLALGLVCLPHSCFVILPALVASLLGPPACVHPHEHSTAYPHQSGMYNLGLLLLFSVWP